MEKIEINATQLSFIDVSPIPLRFSDFNMASSCGHLCVNSILSRTKFSAEEKLERSFTTNHLITFAQ